MRQASATLLVLASLLAALSSPCGASARELHWSSVDVRARLDDRGYLYVTERLAFVFTGDWNGGERVFRVAEGQHLSFEGIRRIAPGGEAVPLEEGDLAEVDRYSFTSRNTLRWRSRLPTDPPFDRTEIVYEIEYALSNILLREGDRYVLDHDFAFPDRDGMIERFTLDLELGPAWQPEGEFSGRPPAEPLAPGEGYVLTVPMRHAGPGVPGAWRTAAPQALRHALLAGLLLAFLVGSFMFWSHEIRLGRFQEGPPLSAVDEAWLRREVFSRKPEVVGAAWDNTTAAPEVTALLARLAQEKKLSAEVIKGAGREDLLRLRLLVDPATLEDYERGLVKALFFSGDVTDTVRVREHYKKTGFDPAGKIREPLKKLVAGLVRDKEQKRPTSYLIGLLILGGIITSIVAAARSDVDQPWAVGGMFSCLVFGILGTGFTVPYGNRLRHLPLWALLFYIPLLVPGVTLSRLLLTGGGGIGSLAFLGLSSLLAGFTLFVLRLARTSDGPERLRLRQRLDTARRWFKAELAKPEPRLRDEWFPWLVAFGLGSRVDRWFQAFGGESVSRGMRSSGTSRGASAGSSPWTGGGGTFGGGGASGTWAAAAGTLAAGVARPSSGRSGGGGGGGSSGGGGGGGW